MASTGNTPTDNTTEPMAQSPLAEILVGIGRSVVSFDVPGAYRSTREAPLQCSQELFEGIADARLEVFEASGHAPFIEERALIFPDAGVVSEYEIGEPNELQW